MVTGATSTDKRVRRAAAPLRPVGAVLPPDAATWLASHRCGADHSAPPSTGPPPAQLRLPLAG
jgi:hypothetical protein